MTLAEKDHLPRPYDQDLSGVLRYMNRRTAAGRRELANSPATAAYLKGGMALVERYLGPDALRAALERDDDSLDRPLLAFLSQRAVVTEMAGNPPPFFRQGSLGALRATWASQSHYIADLLSFGLWSRQYGVTYDSLVSQREEWLTSDANFRQAIELSAFWEREMLTTMPLFRLQLLAIATAEGDDVIRNAIAENYRTVLDRWREVYERSFAAHGLRLRPGASWDDLTNGLAALAEGLAIRELGDPSAVIVDMKKQTSLLGTLAKAFVVAYLERDDEPPGETFDDALDRMVCERCAAG